MPDERGQATVELAAVLPFVAVLLLVVVQVGVVVRAQVLVVHAAREGARAAAVDPSPAAAATAAAASGELAPNRLRVDVEGAGRPGGDVTVTATYRVETQVPLVGALVGDVEVRGTATMRVE